MLVFIIYAAENITDWSYLIYPLPGKFKLFELAMLIYNSNEALG